MSEPVWIEVVDCLTIHEELLARFGGLAGVRDRGLLESALNRPNQLLHYGKPDLFDLAASYAAGIAKNHPFLDGNKRAAFMVAALFLEINNVRLSASEEDAVLQTLGLAAGEISEKAYAVWLRASCSRPATP